STDGSTTCGSSTSPDVWYTFTLSDAAFVTADLCGGASWDTVLSIHTACPGTAANAVACNDDTCNYQSRVAASLNAGVPYYLRVSGFSSNHTGDFTVLVTTGTAPPPPPPPPPPPTPPPPP